MKDNQPNHRIILEREDVVFRIWLYQSKGATKGVVDLMREIGNFYLDANEAKIHQDMYGILRLMPRERGKDIPEDWHPIIETNLLAPISVSAIKPYKQHVYGKGQICRVSDLKHNFIKLELKQVEIVSPQEYNCRTGRLFGDDWPENYEDTPTQRRPKIFLCHASKDKKFVRRLSEELQENGIDTWLDENEILVGQSFINRMEEGIRESDFIVVVLTPNFLQGIWANQELQMALIHEVEVCKVKILPILKRDCDIPGFLRSKSYADFRGNKFEKGMRNLMQSIFRLQN